MKNELSDLRLDIAGALLATAKETAARYDAGEKLSPEELSYCSECQSFFAAHHDLTSLLVKSGIGYRLSTILLFNGDPAAEAEWLRDVHGAALTN